MRIAIGCFAQESHSFSPIPGSWAHFSEQEITRGPAMFDEFRGTGTEIGGLLSVLDQSPVELLPLMAARASASAGTMQRGVFEALRDDLVRLLHNSLPVDAVLLVLHGATLAEGYDDASGEILYQFREVLGTKKPLITTLDLHANVTQKMVDHATALVGYHTYPHVDMYETGQRGAKLLLNILENGVKPHTAFRKIPMILPGETTQTTSGPYADAVNRAQDHMANSPGVLDVSVFSVQPWLDVEDMGSSVVVVTDKGPALGDRVAQEIAVGFWSRRKELLPHLPDARQAVTTALQSSSAPVILADAADAPTSGAPGDSTMILKILLESAVEKPCLLNIVDPQAVQAMADAGIGATISLTLGASLAPAFYDPIEVTGTVRLLSDGTFTHKGPGMRGLKMHRGLTGVLQINTHIALVVMERSCWQWDAELYRSVGLEPADAQLVVVKSPTAFRASYEVFAGEIIVTDSKGLCSPDLRAFPFQNIRRPIFPLDDFEWQPDNEVR